MTVPDLPTSGGVEVTDELVERLASRAEQGYDVGRLRARPRRNRPPVAGRPAPSEESVRATVLWLEESLLVAATRRAPLQTVLIDDLPPWRANLLIQVCVAAGARLEHGTIELLAEAASAAWKRDPHATGWWREALHAAGVRL